MPARQDATVQRPINQNGAVHGTADGSFRADDIDGGIVQFDLT
jgi:hypothetical protein